MKTRTIVILIAAWLIQPHPAGAERIYLDDDRVIDAQIAVRDKDGVGIRYSAGELEGMLRIDAKNIRKIENDDGTVSKYDYESVIKVIQDYIEQKKYGEAASLCGSLLESFPDNPQIHYLRGVLSQKLGDEEGAVRDYKFLIERGKADAHTLNNLAAIYAAKKDYHQASDLFLQAIEKDPAMLQAHENLAALFLETRDYARAIDEYRVVMESDPENASALYNSGIAYARSGDIARAREQWERVLVINPEDADASQALEQLKAGSPVE